MCSPLTRLNLDDSLLIITRIFHVVFVNILLSIPAEYTTSSSSSPIVFLLRVILSTARTAFRSTETERSGSHEVDK